MCIEVSARTFTDGRMEYGAASHGTVARSGLPRFFHSLGEKRALRGPGVPQIQNARFATRVRVGTIRRHHSSTHTLLFSPPGLPRVDCTTRAALNQTSGPFLPLWNLRANGLVHYSPRRALLLALPSGSVESLPSLLCPLLNRRLRVTLRAAAEY
ncbi:hypothetical protein MRX96_033589 [Rhipicephalus microplus]